MTNQSNDKLITYATWDLGDWFSRLGGSARYAGMTESHIFLYVAATVAEKFGLIDDRMEYVRDCFIEAAERTIDSADERLGQLHGTRQEMMEHLLSYVEYYDKKLKNERSPEWDEFCQKLRAISID